MKLALAAAAIAASLALPAFAKEIPAQETPQAVQQLLDCRAVTDASERLACYDRQVAALDQAQRDKQLVIVDREQIKEAKRGLFGFSLPKIKLFGDGDDNDEEQVKELTSTLERASQMANGRWSFYLPDGAHWVQIDSQETFWQAKAGDEIVIKRGPLGNYMANVAGHRGIRVSRVD
jgi:hypothetical protein